MKFGSLFAGIGGIDLGLERAGMECAWQVEIDDYCNKVLEKHWPDVPRYKDVRDVGRNLESVDLIAGGFPCQPHSVAGKRKGATDDRNLWPEYFRVIKELKPRYVLAENVPGIVSTYIDTVLSDLESQAYTCRAFNIPACAIDAPHRRERIFVVAYSDERRPRRKNESQCKHNAMEGCEQSRGDGKNRNVADTESESRNVSHDNRGCRPRQIPKSGNCIEATRPFSSWWSIEPDVGRVAHGIPSRVDRLRALGNAVVPQVAKWIGRRIMEYDKSTLRQT